MADAQTVEEPRRYAAFAGMVQVAHGELPRVLQRAHAWLEQGEAGTMLFFEDWSGRQVDFDLSGTEAEVLARVAEPPRAGPGRPKLGVISREVSLLPRHWDWLEQQPQGISAALRRLVDEARKRAPEAEKRRLAIEAANRFMTSLAGNLENYEEATRALFAGDEAGLQRAVGNWPADLKDYLKVLLAVPDETRG